MGDKSKIAWTDASWNPTIGCSIASEGCLHCYAARDAHNRLRLNPNTPYYRGLTKAARGGRPFFNGTVRCMEERLDQPMRWRKPRKIFVNSMSDLFHPKVPDEFIDRVFAVMALAPQHTFQVLTKRPERMAEYMAWTDTLEAREGMVADAAARVGGIVWDPRGSEQENYLNAVPKERLALRRRWPGWPLPNVWLGVSVENQRWADERIPLLLQTPAAVRWLSCEPLLGPVSLRAHHPHLDWVVVGDESGPDRREADPGWVRDIRDECAEGDTPLFLKQLHIDSKRVETPEFEGRRWTQYPSR